jgi:hypothetical protein
MILTFLITQQKMGKIKRLLTQAGNASRLEMCKQKLNYSQELFKVHSNIFMCAHIQVVVG